MRRRLIAAVAGGALVAGVGLSVPAAAEDHVVDGRGVVRGTNVVTGDPSIRVGTTSSTPGRQGATNVPSARRAGGSGSVVCTLYEPEFFYEGAAPASPVEGRQYVRWCRSADGLRTTSYATITYSPANAGGAPMIDPETLALQAFRELPLEYPDVRTSPPSGVPAVVHVPVVLWIEPGQWRPLTATAAVPGLSATLTARPVRVEWDMGGVGDDGPVTCEGPGTPYDPSELEDVPLRDREELAEDLWSCYHLYRVTSREEITDNPDEEYQAEATLVWEVSWSASDGSGGPLPDVRRSTTFPMVVGEYQALNTVVDE